MIPYLSLHLFTIVRSFFEMFHNLYLTFSEEDGYGLSYICAEEVLGNLLYTIFWFIILRVFLDLMRPAKSPIKNDVPEINHEEIFKIEIEPEKKYSAGEKMGGA